MRRADADEAAAKKVAKETVHEVRPLPDVVPGADPGPSSVIRNLIVGLLGAVILYGALYAYMEVLTYRYGERNRFFQIVNADADAQWIILGASRALPLEFGDFHAEMERAAGGPVYNLSMPGAGVVPNFFLLDYFLSKRHAAHVLYILDSFAFYSAEWNEERFHDPSFWRRAPLDVGLARKLWRARRDLGVPDQVFWAYITGFPKMNSPSNWYEPDRWEAEPRFHQVYRTNRRMDRARIDYLYPDHLDEGSLQRYLRVLLRMVDMLEERDIAMTVVKPPLRESFYDAIPGEAEFDRAVHSALNERGVPFYDFSLTGFDDALFYDPDHLNEEGVRRFLHELLLPVLEPYVRTEPR